MRLAVAHTIDSLTSSVNHERRAVSIGVAFGELYQTTNPA